MAYKDENNLDRLAAAVDAWTSHASDSHRLITARVGGAVARMETLLAHLAGNDAEYRLQQTTRFLEQQIVERDRRIADLESTAITLQRELEALRDAVRTTKQARRHYTADSENLRTALAEANAHIAQQDAEIQRLTQAHAVAPTPDTTNEATQGTKITEPRAECETLRKECEEAKRQQTALTTELEAAMHARDAAHTHAEELAARQRVAEDVAAQLEQALRDREEAHNEIYRLRAQLRNHEEQAADRDPAPAGAKPVGGADFAAFDAQGHKRRIGEILIELGVIDSGQRDAILAEQQHQHQHDRAQRFGTIAVSRGYTDEVLVARILAAQLKIPFQYLDTVAVAPDVRALVPADVAIQNDCLPLANEGDQLHLAMANPLDLIAIENIEIMTGLRVGLVVSTPSEIRAAIDRVYAGEL
ncbi:MAG: hypothetical protein ACLFTT_03070 [Candidatus Hydrogenedentota bacterium]